MAGKRGREETRKQRKREKTAMKSTCTVSTATTLKQQRNGRGWLLPLSPFAPVANPCARAARVIGPRCHTDALARVCPSSAPSTDDVGTDDALQPGLPSASWAAPNKLNISDLSQRYSSTFVGSFLASQHGVISFNKRPTLA
jgi:hypothetical protein